MDHYAVFGNPIKHSKSPFIHTLFAEQTLQQMVYSAIEPAIDDFESALNIFFRHKGKAVILPSPSKSKHTYLPTS